MGRGDGDRFECRRRGARWRGKRGETSFGSRKSTNEPRAEASAGESRVGGKDPSLSFKRQRRRHGESPTNNTAHSNEAVKLCAVNPGAPRHPSAAESPAGSLFTCSHFGFMSGVWLGRRYQRPDRLTGGRYGQERNESRLPSRATRLDPPLPPPSPLPIKGGPTARVSQTRRDLAQLACSGVTLLGRLGRYEGKRGESKRRDGLRGSRPLTDQVLDQLRVRIARAPPSAFATRRTAKRYPAEEARTPESSKQRV